MKKTVKTPKRILYFTALALSVLLLAAGYLYVIRGGRNFTLEDSAVYVRAKVTEITNVNEEYTDDGTIETSDTYFAAKITSRGEYRGRCVTSVQNYSSYTPFNPRPVKVGDSVILGKFEDGAAGVTEDSRVEWNFVEHVRSDALIVLAVLFVLLVLAFGRIKGLKTVVSLALTLASVFFVFLPAVILGENIYLWAVLICIYITVMTLCIVNGISPMSLAAMAGCTSGVLTAAAITLATDCFIKLSGYTDSCSVYLLYIGAGNLDLRALIYGSILIGSVGAVMDVSVDISASLKEIAAKLKTPTFRELLTSGFNIGRDVIGTMSNTLVLAYIGGSMCSLLLYMYNVGGSPVYLFNLEPIVVEALKILVGSCGIMLTLPITSFICAYLYTRPKMLVEIISEVNEGYETSVQKKDRAEKTDEYGGDEYSVMLENNVVPKAESDDKGTPVKSGNEMENNGK